MKYNVYLKELGMSRWQYFRLKHKFLFFHQLFEKIKYGTTCHEMWSMPIILACELYPRLRRLRDKYDFVLSLSHDCQGRSFQDLNPDIDFNTDEWHEKYTELHNANFDKILKSLEHNIKCYLNFDYEMEHDSLEQQKKDAESMALVGWNFWSLGI